MSTISHFIQKHFYLFLLVLVGCSPKNSASAIHNNDSIYQGLEFDMPKIVEPVFPDFSVLITKYGAVGDGQTLNTKAIAKAINVVSEHGGGTVNIPRGIWLTGPIILKSNVNIHTAEGALVLFSTDKDLYPLIDINIKGVKSVHRLSPIYGKDLENVAFTGHGIFDGSGDAWRPVKKAKLTGSQWKELVASGGVVDEKGDVWYPSEQYLTAAKLTDNDISENFKTLKDYQKIKDRLRPVLVYLINCNKVLLDGPVFQNSPDWCLHPLMCQNLTIRNVDVRNPWYAQNGDGIDIESCKNSALTNCTFDVGDDAICVKSGKDKAGRDRGMPTENLIVKNCTVYHGHGGFTVGSEMSGGVKNLHVSDCTFIGTNIGLRFKSTRGRGGVVQKVYISNIDMIHVPDIAISFNLYYNPSAAKKLKKTGASSDEESIPSVNEGTPQFKDISIKNITCKGARQAIYLQGLPEMNLQNVNLENLNMEATKGMVCMDADSVTIRNLHLQTTKFPAITLTNSKNVAMNDLYLSDSKEPLISIQGEKSKQVKINLMSKVENRKFYELGQTVNRSSIEIEKR